MYQFGYNLSFSDLCSNEAKIDEIFLSFLNQENTQLYMDLLHARTNATTDIEKDALWLELGEYVQEFIANIFANKAEVVNIAQQYHAYAPILHLKKSFIQKQAAYATLDGTHQQAYIDLQAWLGEFDELTFAKGVIQWQQDGDEEKLHAAQSYAAWAVQSVDGQHKHRHGFLFALPHKHDPFLIRGVHSDGDCHQIETQNLVLRSGFGLTDPGMEFGEVANQLNYCLYCHKQQKDSCSKGFIDRHTSQVKTNAHNIKLSGCPLGQKISQSQMLMKNGWIIGALAMITVDNPMVAATGHRICTDCSRSCIYQAQDAVDIPAVETALLDQILDLPFGFEIYSLLTRWNPLNFAMPYPKDKSSHNVLVVGMGPAGFTLAHYLLNHGHQVVAVDGLKIEPLDPQFLQAPIPDIKEFFGDLDRRDVAGFGGVAEYGITSRWNKNYLLVIRLLLQRREQFHLFDGVRFGGTITPQQAFALGFDHIALCSGAGAPKSFVVQNWGAKGVRYAADFLMSLQLSGAAQPQSMANLQIRLPVLVIGGGLTAVDTATEALAYYPIQVEKFLQRYEALVQHYGQAFVEHEWSPEDRIIAKEFLEHARALQSADAVHRLQLLQQWGGVSILYRGQFKDSPAFRLNREELYKALQEGILFYDTNAVQSLHIDQFGHVSAAQVETSYGPVIREAKCVLSAIGTEYNTTLAQEFSNDFKTDTQTGAYKMLPSIPGTAQFLLDQSNGQENISVFGDANPYFAGSVVKAMASAKQGHTVICDILAKNPSESLDIQALTHKLHAHIVNVESINGKIFKIVVHAPMAAENFQPGQFYRLQNYSYFSQLLSGTKLVMEGLALTGASVDKERGLIDLYVLNVGGSSGMCGSLKPGERIVLMGPTGEPTQIVADQNVVLVGGGLGNAVLFSIGQALREKGCKIIYFAGFRDDQSVFARHEIEKSADLVVWCLENGALQCDNNIFFQGNVVQGLEYFQNNPQIFNFLEIEHVITIGSDKMMQAVKQFFLHRKDIFAQLPSGVCSVNSLMQCMMKGICGQCVQRHFDTKTNQEWAQYSCINQDQNLWTSDLSMLGSRLQQNSVSEKISARWIELCKEI